MDSNSQWVGWWAVAMIPLLLGWLTGFSLLICVGCFALAVILAHMLVTIMEDVLGW